MLFKFEISHQTCHCGETYTYLCTIRSGCSYRDLEVITCADIINLDGKALSYFSNPYCSVLLFNNSILNTISYYLFDNFPVHNIEMLYLNDTQIKEVKRQSFNKFQSLSLLNIAQNSLTKIYVGTFDRLQNLLYLNLSSNLLSSIDDDLFDDLELIETIDLSYNNIITISSNIFQRNQNLVTLLLNNNKIIEIPDHIFSRCLKLRILSLAMNNISKINNSTFSNIFKETNQLQHIELDLSYNNLLYLDSKIFFQSKIQLLKLNNNFLSIDEFFFTFLSECQNLDLSCIAPIDLKFVNMKGTLKFQHTIFKTKTEFGDSIIKLDLRSTMIHLDPSSFKTAKSLKYLFLDNNNLTYISEDLFANLNGLEYLSLTNSSLSIIPTGIFRNLHNLQNLYLNNNNISTLELGVFSSLENLYTLNLASNKFKNLDASILYNLLNIKNINISNNLLSYFNIEDFVIHIHRKYEAFEIQITLDTNFWSCNWLIKAVSIARKNNIIIPKGNSHKVHNVKGIACKKDNIFWDITTLTRQQEVLTSRRIAAILTTKIPQRTTTADFQKTTKIIPAYTYTSEIATTAEHQFINEKASTETQQKPVPEKYLFSTETNHNVLYKMTNNSNQNQEILKTMSDIRGLLAFIMSVICVIICWKIYIKIFKRNNSRLNATDNRCQVPDIELIDNNENDDNEEDLDH